MKKEQRKEKKYLKKENQVNSIIEDHKKFQKEEFIMLIQKLNNK